MQDHQSYNKALRPLAAELRQSATKAEACLWKYVLRAGLMRGYTFRRQRPVLSYVADFMCQPLMLIIELDVALDVTDEVSANDIIRQRRLEEAGFTVMRFENKAVLHKIIDVQKVIESWIVDFEQKYSIPEKAKRAKATKVG